MDQETRYGVDQLLLEQGEYTPLSLLLAEGRLQYRDYEDWRSGEQPLLADALFGEPIQIQRLLEEGARYCKALGLTPKPVEYRSWGKEEPLRFSDRHALDRLFHLGYGRAEQEPQLDLFMDSAGTSLANAIVRALLERDSSEATQRLDRLYQTDPGHPRLGAFERLVEAAVASAQPPADLEDEVRDLDEEIQPLAQDLLGREAADFLAPLWRRLSEALAGHPFDPARPRLHASYTAARSGDWLQVVIRVESAPDWQTQPRLLRRHARACERLQQPARALQDWFMLCWHCPDAADSLGREALAETARAWQRFIDLEPELPVQCFPAWLLIIRPGLTGWLPAPAGDEPEEYRLLYALQRAEGSTAVPGEQALRLRRQLKALQPALFRHFIANRSR